MSADRLERAEEGTKVELFASEENLDDHGGDLPEACVLVRMADADVARLGYCGQMDGTPSTAALDLSGPGRIDAGSWEEIPS